MLTINKDIRLSLMINYKTGDVVIIVPGAFQALRITRGANDIIPGQLHNIDVVNHRATIEGWFTSKQLLSPKKQLMLLTNLLSELHLTVQKILVSEKAVFFHELHIITD